MCAETMMALFAAQRFDYQAHAKGLGNFAYRDKVGSKNCDGKRGAAGSSWPMFLQPVAESGVHAALPAFAAGLEGFQHVVVETDGG